MSAFLAKLIFPDGNVTDIEPKDGKIFQYRELSDYIGGYLEIIRPPGRRGALLIVDEEGKLKGLPLNRVATLLWIEGCEPGSARETDYVHGTAILCHASQLE